MLRQIEWGSKRSFASNYFIFPKILFQYKNLLQELIWCANYPYVDIHTFRKRWSFYLRVLFPCEYH